MTTTLAKAIVTEQLPDYSAEETRCAWQFLVDNGEVWQMKKRYSDMACSMLAAGVLERNAA